MVLIDKRLDLIWWIWKGNPNLSLLIYSTNSTFLNKEKIESARYYELRHQDTINFAHSTRDYVLFRVDENDLEWLFICLH